MVMKGRQFRSNALQDLYEEVIGDGPERQAMLEQEIVNVEAAQLIYDMRTTAGLTQRELAKRVGTTASVICRLENADYDGINAGDVTADRHGCGPAYEIHAVPLTMA